MADTQETLAESHMRPTHHFVDTGQVTLHTVQAGPREGPLTILLHGFPEYWRGWKNQIPALARAGYHVWAPDQRGYNLSDKPRDLAAYNVDRLVQDVVGLVKAAGRQQTHLVGHDWGAAVAWRVAIKYPHVVRRLAILNVPHPSVGLRFALRSREQKLRSWYIAFFQIPRLPESLIRLGNWQAGRRTMVASSRPDTFTAQDLDCYVSAWSRPGAMRSMLNWYRAAARTRPSPLADIRVHVPTRIIWGANDIALSRQLAPLSLEMCDDGDLFILEQATHWVQHDAPRRVNRLLLDFLQDA